MFFRLQIWEKCFLARKQFNVWLKKKLQIIQDEESPLKTITLLHGEKFSTKCLLEWTLAECVAAVTFDLWPFMQHESKKSHHTFCCFFKPGGSLLTKDKNQWCNKALKVTKTRPTFVARRKATATLRVDSRFVRWQTESFLNVLPLWS